MRAVAEVLGGLVPCLEGVLEHLTDALGGVCALSCPLFLIDCRDAFRSGARESITVLLRFPTPCGQVTQALPVLVTGSNFTHCLCSSNDAIARTVTKA